MSRNTALQQAQFAGAGDGFRPPLNLEFVKDSAVVPFDRVQSQVQPFGDLVIGQSLRNELEHF